MNFYRDSLDIAIAWQWFKEEVVLSQQETA